MLGSVSFVGLGAWRCMMIIMFEGIRWFAVTSVVFAVVSLLLLGFGDGKALHAVVFAVLSVWAAVLSQNEG